MRKDELQLSCTITVFLRKSARRLRSAHISAHMSETKIKMRNVTEVRRFRSDTTRTHTCAACVDLVRLWWSLSCTSDQAGISFTRLSR